MTTTIDPISVDPTTTAPTATMSRERSDLLETLGKHRFFLRFTARDLTHSQAAATTTASVLCIGGLIKHVSAMEAVWARFLTEGPSAFGSWDFESWGPEEFAERAMEFQLLDTESLESVFAAYEQVANTTDALVASLPDLDVDHALPEAPWFEAGARWSARRAILHIIAETAQHAGHADIIRESFDGGKTMG
jgi:hypothetical protein